MKTNPSAGHLLGTRVIALCLALAAMLGAEFMVGISLTSRVGQMVFVQKDGIQAPHAGLVDLMAAASEAR